MYILYHMFFHMLFVMICKLTGFVTCVLLCEVGPQMEILRENCVALEIAFHVGHLLFAICLYLHQIPLSFQYGLRVNNYFCGNCYT